MFFNILGGIFIKRKLIIATLLIFALITLGCVSAADDIQTDDTVAIDDDTIEEEILTDTNNEPGTFRALSSSIPRLDEGRTYTLTKDYTYNESTDSSYKNGISVSGYGGTLDGNGHTLNGNNQAHIIQRSSYITFKNI